MTHAESGLLLHLSRFERMSQKPLQSHDWPAQQSSQPNLPIPLCHEEADSPSPLCSLLYHTSQPGNRPPYAHMSKPAGQAARNSAPNLLRLVYERNPRPFNCTTLEPTKSFAEDTSHPLHIKTQRRLDQFDPAKLHWRVRCPIDVSKKVVIRRWAIRRFQVAFLKQLREAGFDSDGALLEKLQPWHGKRRSALTGAALMILPKDSRSLKADDRTVDESCRAVLEDVKHKADRKQQQNQVRTFARTAKGGRPFEHGRKNAGTAVPIRPVWGD